MPKHPSQKLWQKAHKDKVNKYRQNYMKDKVQVTVILEAPLVKQIDKVKKPGESYANCLKRIAELWIDSAVNLNN